MILAFAAVAVAGVLARPLVPIDETRYVDVAWEMRLMGSWFLPLKNYDLYTDKPPMLFWLINLVWTMTGGVTEFAARLVGPAFAVATLWGSWLLGRRLWDDTTGAVAAVVLAGMSVFAIYGGATMFDTLLSAATLAGLLALVAAMAAPGVNRRAWAGFGLALAFGVLAKGPVILFHLAPAVAAAFWWSDPLHRPSGRAFAQGLALSIGVALAIVALWVVPAAIMGGEDYRRMILWEQTAGRTVKSFAHARPLWWLMALLPLILFPWVFTPGLWSGLRRISLADRGLRLLAVQAGSGLLLFSLISGKQVHYLVPEMPATALIFARAFLASGQASGRVGLAGRLSRLPLAGLLGLFGLLPLGAGLGWWGDEPMQALMQPLAATLGFAIFCALLAAIVVAMPRLSGLAMAGLGLVFGLNGLIAATGLAKAIDSRTIAIELAPHEADGIAVLTSRYNEEFDFTGQLLRRIDTPRDAPEAEAWLRAHPSGILAAICTEAPLKLVPSQRIYFNGDDWCLWHAEG